MIDILTIISLVLSQPKLSKEVNEQIITLQVNINEINKEIINNIKLSIINNTQEEIINMAENDPYKVMDHIAEIFLQSKSEVNKDKKWFKNWDKRFENTTLDENVLVNDALISWLLARYETLNNLAVLYDKLITLKNKAKEADDLNTLLNIILSLQTLKEEIKAHDLLECDKIQLCRWYKLYRSNNLELPEKIKELITIDNVKKLAVVIKDFNM